MGRWWQRRVLYLEQGTLNRYVLRKESASVSWTVKHTEDTSRNLLGFQRRFSPRARSRASETLRRTWNNTSRSAVVCFLLARSPPSLLSEICCARTIAFYLGQLAVPSWWWRTSPLWWKKGVPSVGTQRHLLSAIVSKLRGRFLWSTSPRSCQFRWRQEGAGEVLSSWFFGHVSWIFHRIFNVNRRRLCTKCVAKQQFVERIITAVLVTDRYQMFVSLLLLL